MQSAELADPPTPHRAPHNGQPLCLAAGVPPATVQAILGHATLRQAGEYVDVAPAGMADGLARLSTLYSVEEAKIG